MLCLKLVIARFAVRFLVIIKKARAGLLFGCCQSVADTVYVWRRLKNKTGSVAQKPVDCSKRRRIINDEVLLAYLAKHPEAYLSDMAALLLCQRCP